MILIAAMGFGLLWPAPSGLPIATTATVLACGSATVYLCMALTESLVGKAGDP